MCVVMPGFDEHGDRLARKGKRLKENIATPLPAACKEMGIG
jgi:hypothetical protein